VDNYPEKKAPFGALKLRIGNAIPGGTVAAGALSSVGFWVAGLLGCWVVSFAAQNPEPGSLSLIL
jgi:hypothetical protein